MNKLPSLIILSAIFILIFFHAFITSLHSNGLEAISTLISLLLVVWYLLLNVGCILLYLTTEKYIDKK